MNNANKTIIRNTMYLYLRMVITTIISLFTVRVVLLSLGQIDYGIYNVIVGVIFLFSFLNNAMTSSTQRHLSYEMVTNNTRAVSETFNASLRIHFFIGLFIVLLGETIGLHFVKTTLNIPPDRLDSAVWIYHCVVVTFFLNILIVPYQAMINAKEDMGIIAFLGIYESVGKLAIAFLITYISFDKLKTYGILLLLLSASVIAFLHIFCSRKYPESRINAEKIPKKLYSDLTSFAGWTIFGTLASIVRTQGATVLLNIFLGPIINAAYGVANQIASQISSFAQTMLKPVNPQIVKSFGKENLNEMFRYMNSTSKFSFYLFLVIAIPLYLEMEFILGIWLKSVPEYTLIFSRLMLINCMIDIMIGPLITAIQATAKIKYYQLISGTLFLLNLPVMYILLHFGFPPVWVIISNVVFTCLVGIIRLYFLRRLINFPVYLWVKEVFFRCIRVMLFSLAAILPAYILISKSWLQFFVVILSSLIFCLTTIYFTGLNTREKSLLIEVINKKTKKWQQNYQ